MRRKAMATRAIPALAAAVIGTAIVASHATATAKGHSVPNSTTQEATTSQTVTLLWIDADTGKVTKTWSGSQAEADILRSSYTPPPASQSPADVIPDSVRVNGCSDPNSYWDVRNYPPLVCFAYAGDFYVTIYNVYEVDSGNNVGNFTYTSSSGRSYLQYLNRWTSVYFSSRVTVRHIHIN